MQIKIGTLNVCNNYDNKNRVISNSRALANHILDNNYDVLCVQELTKNYKNNLLHELSNYKAYGRYRYGILGKIKYIESYNECTGIITKLDILNYKTKYLPFIPNTINGLKRGLKKGSIIPRTYTLVRLKIDNNIISIISVHLDYHVKDVQVRELNKLYKIILKEIDKNLVIVAGDFNMEIKNNEFGEFIKKLENIGIKRININDKTNSNKFKRKNAIDHIFTSSDINIIQYGLIDGSDIELITDHKGLYIKFEIK